MGKSYYLKKSSVDERNIDMQEVRGIGYSQNSADLSALPLPELTDTGESSTVGGSGAQDPRWEIFFYCVVLRKKNAPELGDTTTDLKITG